MRLFGFTSIGCCGNLGRGHFRILRRRIWGIGIGFIIRETVYQRINHLTMGGWYVQGFMDIIQGIIRSLGRNNIIYPKHSYRNVGVIGLYHN